MSDRLPKVNSLIARELGSLFARELELPKGSLATITRVDAESDLKTAKVFLRIYPPQKEKDTLEYIKIAAPRIQRLLNRRLQMRFVPQLFYRIESEEELLKAPTDTRDEVEKILDSLKNNP